MPRLKEIFLKIRKYFLRNICYNDMEWKNQAVFSICEGRAYVENGAIEFDELCRDCPYLVENRRKAGKL